jgi:hypothetical protein
MSRESSPAPKRGQSAPGADKTARPGPHRARQAEKLRRRDGLLHAVRNPPWADPKLYWVTQHRDVTELLQALPEHYRRHHWCRTTTPGPDEGGQMSRT